MELGEEAGHGRAVRPQTAVAPMKAACHGGKSHANSNAKSSTNAGHARSSKARVERVGLEARLPCMAIDQPKSSGIAK